MQCNATLRKTCRSTQWTWKPLIHTSFAHRQRLHSRVHRDLHSASNKRTSHTCTYSVVAGSFARRDQGAMFSMAIRTGQVDTIRDMLDNGTKAISLDEPGATMLSFAACKAQEAQEALHAATQHYTAHADPEGQLILEDAREHQQATLEIVSLLLAHGGGDSDELYTPGNGHTSPGHSSAEDSYQYRYKPRRLLHQAAIWNNAAVADLLLQHEADENARDHNEMLQGWSPLHHAAANNHVATARALVSHGAAISFRDNSNVTPLHLAAKADALEVCQLLLSHGAGKHARDQAGDMPLHAAAQHAGPAVIKLMLENGCNPVAENLLGKVPSDLADRSGNEEVMHLLVAACIECQMALRNPAADSTEPLPPGNSALELSLTQAFQSQVYLY